MSALTAVILTYNESSHIEACVDTLRFADRVLVFDSFSTDDTVALAEAAGASVLQQAFVDYPSQRNAALNAVGQGWVLFVDADERVTPALAEAVQAAVTLDDHAAWQIARHNYIFGRLTLGAGWFPDYQTRLLKVGLAHYDPARAVHEVIVLDGPLGTIDEPLIHYNYRDAAQFAAKQRRYSDYEADILFRQGVRPKPRNFVLQPARQFWWRFRTLKGYRDGLHGLRLSLLMGWYELRKYRVLRSRWRDAGRNAQSGAADQSRPAE